MNEIETGKVAQTRRSQCLFFDPVSDLAILSEPDHPDEDEAFAVC